jgi:hypothetical protein
MIGEIKKSNFNIQGFSISKSKLSKDKKAAILTLEGGDYTKLSKIVYSLGGAKQEAFILRE